MTTTDLLDTTVGCTESLTPPGHGGTVAHVQGSSATDTQAQPPVAPPAHHGWPRRRVWGSVAAAAVLGAGITVAVVSGLGQTPSERAAHQAQATTSVVPGGDPSAEAKASAPPTEGPVTEAHAWADGVSARVVSVTPAPTDLGFSAHDPANDTGLAVTIEFTNGGKAPIAWDTSTATPDWQLLYGVNRAKAEGYAAPDSNLPTRLMPGTTATWTTINFLPHDQVGHLDLSVTPLWNDPAHQPWTFTGVDQLVGR